METLTDTPADGHDPAATARRIEVRAPQTTRRHRGLLISIAALAVATATVVALIVAVAAGHHTDGDTGNGHGVAPQGTVRSEAPDLEDAVEFPPPRGAAAQAQRADRYEREAHLDGLAATYGHIQDREDG